MILRDIKTEENAFQKMQENLIPDCEHTFEYQGHLSDNREIVETIYDYACRGGLSIELIAGCGSGKTTAVCVDLAKKLYMEKNIILLTPNSIQSEQNGEKYSGNGFMVQSVTAKNQGMIYRGDTVSSVVYDSIDRVSAQMSLEKMVLVIDEAHQLYDARNYRPRAIAKVEELAESVISAGGTVVYMTGTPRKIEGRKFDVVIRCERVDENGAKIPDFMGKELNIIRKDTNKATIMDLALTYISEEARKGKIPLVRLNSKAEIRKAARFLHAKNFKILTLTSDDKGWHSEKIVDFDEDGDPNARDVDCFDSEMYGDIMQHQALPFADIYITTSILEVGTSIEYVRDRNGNPVKPASIEPIYIVRNKEEFDFDNITQYLARTRFPFDCASIIMNKMGKGKHGTMDSLPDPKTILRNLYKNTFYERQALAKAGFARFGMLKFSKEEEGRFVGYDDNYMIDEEAMHGAAWEIYDGYGYSHPELTKDMFITQFQLPSCQIHVEDYSSLTSIKKEETIYMPEDVKDEFKKIYSKIRALEKEAERDGVNSHAQSDLIILRGDLTNGPDIDYANPVIQAIDDAAKDSERNSFGREVLRNMRTNAAVTEEKLSTLLLVAVQSAATGSDLVVKDGKITDMVLVRKNRCLDILEKMTPRRIDMFINYYNLFVLPMHRKKKDRKHVRKDIPAKRYSLGYYFKDPVECHAIEASIDEEWMYNFFRAFNAGASIVDWKKLIKLFRNSNSTRENEVVQMLYYTTLNTWEVNSETYLDFVAPLTLISGMEYDTLRRLERVAGYNLKTAAKGLCPDCGDKPFDFKRGEHSVIHYKHAKYLAWYLSYRIKINFGKTVTYSPETILEHLKLIYSVKPCGSSYRDSDGHLQFVLTGLRTLRKRMPFEEKEDKLTVLGKINDEILNHEGKFEDADIRRMQNKLAPYYGKDLAAAVFVNLKYVLSKEPASYYEDKTIIAMCETAVAENGKPESVSELVESGKLDKYVEDHADELYPDIHGDQIMEHMREISAVDEDPDGGQLSSEENRISAIA